MSKKKKKQIPTPEKPKDNTEYYKLNKTAVDRLVNATKESVPEISDKEINEVSGRRKFHIPDFPKAMFIKWWFAGAVCFFFFFGLGIVITNQIDLLFVVGVALGAVSDLLTNNVLRHFEPYDHAYDKYMFVTVRQFWSLFLNVIYFGVVMYIIVYIYTVINSFMNYVNGTETEIYLQVGPLLFGLFALIIDMLFITIKRTLKKIIDDAKAGSRR